MTNKIMWYKDQIELENQFRKMKVADAKRNQLTQLIRQQAPPFPINETFEHMQDLLRILKPTSKKAKLLKAQLNFYKDKIPHLLDLEKDKTEGENK